MTALALAFALWGLLAFAGWWMWLRAQTPKAGPLDARVGAAEAKVQAALDLIGMVETNRRKLSKRVGDLEFRHLGKRMTPPEDEA